MYPSYIVDPEDALEGLVKSLSMFDSIKEEEAEVACLLEALRGKKEGSNGFKNLEKLARRKATALGRRSAVLQLILTTRLPTVLDVMAFLGLSKFKRLPGASGSFKADPFNLIKMDAKATEVRLESFVKLLMVGGAQGSKNVTPCICFPPSSHLSPFTIGTTVLVDWLAPDNGRAILSLTLTHINILTLEEAISVTEGGLAGIIGKGTFAALVNAMGGKEKAEGPFCLLQPQLLWPPKTHKQLEALFKTRDRLKEFAFE